MVWRVFCLFSLVELTAARRQFSSLETYVLHTVKPGLSEPVLNGHPLLSGHLSKPRKSLPLISVNLRSPLFNGRGHPFQSPTELFLLFSPVVNGHFVQGNNSTTSNVIRNNKYFLKVNCLPAKSKPTKFNKLKQTWCKFAYNNLNINIVCRILLLLSSLLTSCTKRYCYCLLHNRVIGFDN